MAGAYNADTDIFSTHIIIESLSKTTKDENVSSHRLKNLTKQPNIKIDQDKIKQVHHSRLLGVEIDEKLSWNKHVENVAKKATSGIGAIRRIRDFVDRETLISIYNALVRPHFDYCSEVWDTLGIGHSTRLQKPQNRAARIIMSKKCYPWIRSNLFFRVGNS